MSVDLSDSLRISLGAVFALAAIAKVRHRETLAPFLAASGLSGKLASPISRLVPWCELMLAVWLLTGIFALPATILATIVLASFCAALAAANARGGTESCRCFGALDQSAASWWTVTRTAGLLIAATSVAIHYTRTPHIAFAAVIERRPSVLVSGLACGISYVLGFALANEVRSFRQLRRSKHMLARGFQHGR